MRIVAGSLGGRIFASPSGHKTHPMGERPRGALFNTLGDITGLSVLDAFAGSGAIAFESISRGAAQVTAVEAEKGAFRTIQENQRLLGVSDEQFHAVRAYVHSWIKRQPEESFDIIVADPPYDDLQYKTLELLPKYVRKGGLIVYSLPPHGRLVLGDAMELISRKTYGDAVLEFYHRIS